jgi:hypothetical protein
MDVTNNDRDDRVNDTYVIVNDRNNDNDNGGDNDRDNVKDNDRYNYK